MSFLWYKEIIINNEGRIEMKMNSLDRTLGSMGNIQCGQSIRGQCMPFNDIGNQYSQLDAGPKGSVHAFLKPTPDKSLPTVQ